MRQFYPLRVVPLKFTDIITLIGKMSVVALLLLVCRQRLLIPANKALMSRIERKYCLISTSHLAGLFAIFVLLHI